MVRLPLEELCLRVRAAGLKGDIATCLLECPSPPSDRSIERSIELLKQIGAFDAKEQLTDLGRRLVKLPVDVSLGKLLLYGVAMNCADNISTIAAAMSVGKSPFSSDLSGRSQKLAKYSSANSDLIAIVLAYKDWISVSNNQRADFCASSGLSHESLKLIQATKDQLLDILWPRQVFETKEAFLESQNVSAFSVLRTTLACGLYPNLCYYDPKMKKPEQLNSLRSTEVIHVNKNTSFYKDGFDLLSKSLVWVSFYVMSRSGSRLSASDVNWTGIFSTLAGCGTGMTIDHRLGTFTLDGCKRFVKCNPKTAVVLSQFSNCVKELMQKRMSLVDGQIEWSPIETQLWDAFQKIIQSE
jgi:hypothetical protein